jgi:class 3 adenylate cyclase/tetratricopeptide (TPR) repeat protein
MPAVASRPAPAERGATPDVASERRLVSVLFADLVGFTTLSESRDPEEVREALTRYFEIARRIVTRYGGIVEKFIGDAVMAVWGTPVATEDDAERAVRAALDLTAAVSELGAEVGVRDLRARAGVLTGEAAVSLGAVAEGMVAGDLVNTASRVQSAAAPGSVFVGDATRRATEAAVVYEDAGVFELKGKAEPVALWRAVRVVAGARGSLKSAGLEAPFVGRDRELRTVKELFFSCGEDRKAHLVSIVGVAGIGKSRLAWEFYKFFDGLPQVTWYHRGRCLAYGEGVAYWALAEMVRMRARIAENEDAASAVAKLRATLQEHVPDPDERKWIEPRLAHLIGLEERVTADRDDLFAAWRRFFELLAESNPTVMVFEDMQWADASLLDFIEYLLEWSRNHPIYVLTLARPELMDRRPNWGAGSRNFTSLYLEPLSSQSMEDLLAGLVPGLPEDLRRSILARAEGIPLYAVETVRMLLDRGLLAREGSVYRPTGAIDSLDVPETLHALIAARLDGLTPEERKLVQDAAVLGKTFYEPALSAVSGFAREELEPLLASLVRKEVLSIQADQRSPEHGQYGFLQDLLRKVAYETLSKKDRKARHLAAASYLESAWGEEEEEIVEVVASHYLDAYHAAPDAPDAPGIKAQARDMLTRAGRRAASLAAAAEALRYFEQALELADEALARAELQELAGRMAWTGGRLHDAKVHFEAAIASFELIGLSHPAARVSASLAEIEWGEGRIEEGVARMERAFEVLSAEEPDEDLATLAAQLGRLLHFSGRSDTGLERIEFALPIAEALVLPEVLSQALNTKSGILGARGRHVEATALLQTALQIAVDHDLSSAALRAYLNLAVSHNRRDRHVEEFKGGRDGAELAAKVGNRLYQLIFSAGDVSSLAFLGEWDEAMAIAERILAAEDTATLVTGVGTELFVMAFVNAHRGDFNEARRWLQILPGVETSQEVQAQAAYRSVEAQVLRAEGRFAEGLVAAESVLAVRDVLGMDAQFVKDALAEALECAFALGDVGKIDELLGIIEALRPGELTPSVQATGARFGARLAARRGEVDRVEPGFEAAAGIFRECSMPFWLAVTLLEHGEWLVQEDRWDDAGPLLSEARGIFEGLKARPWLERLEKAETRMAGSPVVAELTTR